MSKPWTTPPLWTATSRPASPPTLDQALLRWETAKQVLAAAKEEELVCRREAFALGFGNAHEGTNTLELGNGYELKGVKKFSYKLRAPEGEDIIDAAQKCAEQFSKISNEGSFVADRLFKYSVDMSITEYRKLAEEAQTEEPKKAMLDELNKILEVSDATPTLEIKAPKGKQ